MNSFLKACLLLISIPLLFSFCSDMVNTDEPFYDLVWSDEFEGTDLDFNIWKPWIGPAYNNELQYYTDRKENIFLQDGKLHLQAQRENYNGYRYTSARISTDSTRVGWKKGRFEARMKMPEGVGFWPAFWLMPINEPGWPKGGEIDIMEHRSNEPNTTTGAIHFWRNGCEGTNSQCMDYFVGSHTISDGKLSDGFYIYALEWTDNEFIWYINDIAFRHVFFSEIDASPEAFAEPFYIILNLAVGGTFVDNPNENTEFPQSLVVDYVRVYEWKE